MKSHQRRGFVLGSSITAALVASVLVQVPAAQAVVNEAVIGPLTVTSVVGTATTASTFRFATDRGCPVNDGGGSPIATNNVTISMSGGNAGHEWTDVSLVGSTSSGVSHVAAQSFAISDTFSNIAAGSGLPAPLGTYTVTLRCQNAFATAVSGTFRARLVFAAAVAPETENTFTVAPPLLGALGVSGTSTPATVADTFDFTTPGPCPASISSTATNFVGVTISGGVAGHEWPETQIVTSTSSGVSHVSGQTIPISDTFANIAASNSLPSPLGNYVITLSCQNGLGTSISGIYSTPISFSAAVPPATVTTFALNNVYSTATALERSSATSALGSPVTFTARVTAEAGTLPAGSVSFKEGSSNIGTAQPVAGGAANTAAIVVSSLTAGPHSITATFTPTNAATPADQFTASTSTPVSLTVFARPGAPRSPNAVPGNRAATVRWLNPVSTGGTAILGYTVTASPKVGSATRTCTASASARACVVTGLTNGVGYRFSVVARNAAGSGIGAATPVTVPFAPLAVTWTRAGLVLTGNVGKVAGATSYRINSVGAKVGSGTCRAVGAKERCTITLRKGTSTVTVSALNRGGLPLAKAVRVQKI